MTLDTNFKDHFSEGSDAYMVYRPGYPEELFRYLSSLTQNHDRAWDCATGNGQTALALSNYYSQVIGSDASQNQISHAQQKEGVIYRVEKAEQSSLENHSVDLVTVAQALHWFDIDAFSSELNRVLKPGGVLAVWTYGLLNINPEINDEINTLYGPVLDNYWPPERKMVEAGYKNIEFPFNEIQTPEFQMETEWNLSHLVGYLCTWSAVKKYEAANGVNPVEQRYESLARPWGNPETPLRVQWPLTLRVWIKP